MEEDTTEEAEVRELPKPPPQEKLDAYKLSMFPLMLQTIYNLKQASRHGPRMVPKYERELCEDDAEFILDAFKSIGVVRREGLTRSVDEDGSVYVTFPHFTDQGREAILEKFNPAVEDQAKYVLELRAEIERLNADRKELVDRMSKKVDNLVRENTSLKSRLGLDRKRPKTAKQDDRAQRNKELVATVARLVSEKTQLELRIKALEGGK